MHSYYQIPDNVLATAYSFKHSNTHIRGNLYFRVMQVQNNSVLTAMQLTNVTFIMHRQRINEIEKLLSIPFNVIFMKDGSIKEYVFSNRLATGDENIIKKVIGFFQIKLKNTILNSWKATETDSIGKHKTTYSANTKLLKRKTAYKSSCSHEHYCDHKKIMNSLTSIEIKPPYSWIKNLHGKELIAAYKNKKLTAKSSNSISLKLQKLPESISPKIFRDTYSPESISSSNKKMSKNNIAAMQKYELIQLRVKYKNISWSNLLHQLLSRYKKFNYVAVNKIIDYLKIKPRLTFKILGELKRVKNEHHKKLFLTVLYQINSKTSEKLLSKILLNKEYSTASRIQAAMYLGNRPPKSKHVLPELWKAYNDRDESDDSKRKISNAAVLSLGSIASKLKLSTEKTAKLQRQQIITTISKQLANMPHTNKKCTLLRAAANTHAPEFLNTLKRELNNKYPVVRSVALLALSQYGTTANKVFIDTYKDDPNANVRITAIRSLKFRNIPIELVRDVAKFTYTEKNSFVRNEIYRIARRYLQDEQVYKTLSIMKSRDTDLKNQKLLHKVITAWERSR